MPEYGELPSKIKLFDDEQDLEMEEKDEFQDLLMETKRALKDLRRIKKKIDPILFDIKDGTLVRVAPSRYNERGRKQPSDKNSTIQGMDADDEDNSESSDIDSD